MARMSFYPGPSRVYSKVAEYMYEAYKDGYLTINHRSEEFMSLAAKTKKIFRKKLQIPKDYRIAFVSSATECWEIIAQSAINNHSQHFFNGAFGEKWHKYTSDILPSAQAVSFDINEKLPTHLIDQKAECLCVVHTETSNGSYLPHDSLQALFDNKNEDQLIAIDATSSMAGTTLPWRLADIWFASVQKCFGLPAGLGILILSPKAVERAEQLGDKKRYNSLLAILANEAKHQAHYTPNVLGVYLLRRTLDSTKGIGKVEEKVLNRYHYWTQVLGEFKSFEFLIENEELRAPTVFAITYKEPEQLKQIALEAGFTLGNGYGPWKSSTFRIANFPAIKKKEIEALTKFLQKNVS